MPDESTCQCECGGSYFGCSGLLSDFTSKVCVDCKDNIEDPATDSEICAEQG